MLREVDICQLGFRPIQHEQMVLNYIDKNKTIKRADVADLCRISPQQATRLLKHLIESQDIKLVGDSEGTRYERITEIIVRIRSVAFDYARFRSIACRNLHKR